MPDEAKPRCDDCRFWELVHDEEDLIYGICHRNPPAVVSKPGMFHEGNPAFLDWEIWLTASKKPLTSDEDWCGEFKAKE